MTQPERQDDDLQPILRRFDEEFGPRQEHEPEPIYGEARPIPQPPQQRYQLRLPLGRPRAVWVLLALNVAIYAIPWLLDLVGVSVVAPRLIDQVGSCLASSAARPESVTNYIFELGAKINCR